MQVQRQNGPHLIQRTTYKHPWDSSTSFATAKPRLAPQTMTNSARWARNKAAV